ncbi:toprim domain-containing protein [Lentibacillus sp. CBA3610]|uniref:toprim domain-containing protein n=1 Tax=Lentibacillus sp. CBA3610 TaxID=2518176 RepID=UPI001595535E|nr:toprim domain-containing protein [Lentibacillus sp. CBA3610]QKY69830.1 topoisomerase [Lentibacillus sp. CBA3610]
MTHIPEKVIIVEGLTDKKQIQKVITEDADIICTNGTLGVEKFDELLEDYDLDNRDVYILVDEDEPGIKLRKQLSQELPHAEHVFVSSEYREVATTPENILAAELAGKRIEVNPIFLI